MNHFAELKMGHEKKKHECKAPDQHSSGKSKTPK